MTSQERSAFRALAGCSLRMGSPDKRFVRQMCHEAAQPEPKPLTIRQAHFLWLLVHRYRRQLPAALVREGEFALLLATASLNLLSPPPKWEPKAVRIPCPQDGRRANGFQLPAAPPHGTQIPMF